MENRRPYWQVAVSLLFSILATAAFIVIGIRLIGFLMPFVIGWIVASIATPLVNWLEKRMKIVKKAGVGTDRDPGTGGNHSGQLFCGQPSGDGSDGADPGFPGSV